jgi:hypothetical protein
MKQNILVLPPIWRKKSGLLPLAKNPYQQKRKGTSKNNGFFAQNLPGQKLKFSVSVPVAYVTRISAGSAHGTPIQIPSLHANESCTPLPA